MKGAEIKLVIPDALRVGHEAHFAQVTARFLSYLRDRTQAAGVGTAQHAGEVHGDDGRHGDEPQGPGEGRAPPRAALVGLV